MKIKITETFETIQGEGMFAGAPSFFIRTSGCNLRCWWCDSRYTSWEPEGGLVDLAAAAAAAAASRCGDIVITGGEPMLYPVQMACLVGDLQKLGKRVTIETNGTAYSMDVKPDLWSVSPKLPSSAPSEQFPREREMHIRNMPAVNLRSFKSTQSKLQVKFVVSTQRDLLEVQRMQAEHALSESDIWLMPEGQAADVVMERGRTIAEWCKKTGYNLCLRQHVLLWGCRRGV